MLRRLIRSSALASVGVVSTGVAEYAWFALCARGLSVEDFGTLSVALNVVLMVQTVVAGGLSIAVARFVAVQGDTDRAGQAASSGLALQFGLALVGTVCLGALAALAGWFPSFASAAPLMWLGTAVLIPLALAAAGGHVLLGRGRIAEYNVATVSGPLARLLATIPVALGLAGARLAMLSQGLGAVVSIAWVWIRARKLLHTDQIRPGLARQLLRYAIPSAVASGLVVLFYRSDVVLVSLLAADHPEAAAAQLSTASLLARSLYYLVTSLGIALLPVVAGRKAPPWRAIGQLVGLVVVAIVICALFAAALGSAALGLLFGPQLAGNSDLVPLLFAALGTLGLAQTLSVVLMAAGHPWRAASGLLAGVLTLFALAPALALLDPGPALRAPAAVAWAMLAGAVLTCLLHGSFMRGAFVRSENGERP